ncbi:MAG: ABC transporter permease subunit [Tissierellia bacterium]|nr:ABC transporter permease subunit [Tissierellia bacterium]
MKRKEKIKANLFSLILPILFLLFWQYGAIKIDNNAVLPTVGRIASNFAHALDDFIGTGSLPMNIAYSLVRVFIGYSIGVIIGLPLGLLMGYFKPIRHFFENFISLFKPIPSISWQPLVMGWFGINSIARILKLDYGPVFAVLDNFKVSMIFIIAIGSFFSVWGGAMFGVSNVRKVLVESAEVLGASKSDIFFHVLIPAAGPNIINGLRGGLTSSWACLIAAEMLPGSMNGVGYLITHARELARMDIVITGVIIIGVIGALFDAIFRVIVEKKFSWQRYVK